MKGLIIATTAIWDLCFSLMKCQRWDIMDGTEIKPLVMVYHRRLATTSLTFKRYLYNKINWNVRLVGIKGARGVGKTTMPLRRTMRGRSSRWFSKWVDRQVVPLGYLPTPTYLPRCLSWGMDLPYRLGYRSSSPDWRFGWRDGYSTETDLSTVRHRGLRLWFDHVWLLT